MTRLEATWIAVVSCTALRHVFAPTDDARLLLMFVAERHACLDVTLNLVTLITLPTALTALCHLS